MFTFREDVDVLKGEGLTLKICDKQQGNEVMLPFYYYDIYENDAHQQVGKISIRIGHNDQAYYNGHVGYEINKEHRGKNYSYHALMLVTKVAKAHGMETLYMTCRQSNIASRKIIEKTHATLIEVAQIPHECFFYREGIEDYCIYELKI